jgi:hypothetical protein
MHDSFCRGGGTLEIILSRVFPLLIRKTDMVSYFWQGIPLPSGKSILPRGRKSVVLVVLEFLVMFTLFGVINSFAGKSQLPVGEKFG